LDLTDDDDDDDDNDYDDDYDDDDCVDGDCGDDGGGLVHWCKQSKAEKQLWCNFNFTKL